MREHEDLRSYVESRLFWALHWERQIPCPEYSSLCGKTTRLPMIPTYHEDYGTEASVSKMEWASRMRPGPRDIEDMYEALEWIRRSTRLHRHPSKALEMIIKLRVYHELPWRTLSSQLKIFMKKSLYNKNTCNELYSDVISDIEKLAREKYLAMTKNSLDKNPGFCDKKI